MLCTLFMAMAASAANPASGSVKLFNSTVNAKDAIFVNFTLTENVLEGAKIRVTLPTEISVGAGDDVVATISASSEVEGTKTKILSGASPLEVVASDTSKVIIITTAGTGTHLFDSEGKFVSIKLTNIKNPATAVEKTADFKLSIAPSTDPSDQALAALTVTIDGVAIKSGAFSYGLAMICALLVASQ